MSAENTDNAVVKFDGPKARFKIDATAGRCWPFALFLRRPYWHRRLTGLTWWEQIETFQTREEAKSHYDAIKDLPEYLA